MEALAVLLFKEIWAKKNYRLILAMIDSNKAMAVIQKKLGRTWHDLRQMMAKADQFADVIEFFRHGCKDTVNV